MTNIAAAINVSRRHNTIIDVYADDAKAALVAINKAWDHEWDYQVNDDSVDAWGWLDPDDLEGEEFEANDMVWRIKVTLTPVEAAR